jgi:hypothetical protein
MIKAMGRDYVSELRPPTGLLFITSHPKEGVLRIFIALKSQSSSAGFEPANFVPMASTLTTEDDLCASYE